MLRFALPIALALAAAGCLNNAPPEEDVATASAPEGAEAAVVAPEQAMATEMTIDEGPLTTLVSYEGSTPAGVCQFIVGQCQWAEQGSEDFHMLDVVGQAQWLTVAITYGEQAPGMEFFAAVCPADAEGGDGCSEYVTGPSPLMLDVDLTAFEGGIGISVGSLNQAAGATGAFVFGAADFQVEGVLTSVVNMR